MVKDYSDAKYWELLDTIQDINNTDICFITDGLGDLWDGFQSLIGTLSIEDYVDDMSAYHRKILDMHNISAEKLHDIFQKVRDTDMEYAGSVNEAFFELHALYVLIGSLKDAIDPGTGEFTTSKVNGQTKEALANLDKQEKKFQKAHRELQDKRDARLAAKSGWELVKGCFEFAIDVGKMVLSPNPLEKVAAGWEVINDFFSVANDFSVLGTIAIGWVGGMCGASSFRDHMSDAADEIDDIDGLADQLEYEGAPDVLVGIARGGDLAAGAVNVYYAGKRTLKDIGEAKKVFKSDIFTDETKAAYGIGKLKEWVGFSNTDYSNADPVGKFRNGVNRLKNIKNVYGTAEDFAKGDVAETFAEKNPVGTIGKKIKKAGDALEDLLGGSQGSNKAVAGQTIREILSNWNVESAPAY